MPAGYTLSIKSLQKKLCLYLLIKVSSGGGIEDYLEHITAEHIL